MHEPTPALGGKRAKRRPGVVWSVILALCLLAESRPALGGPIFLSGDDADDFAHCQGTSCGNLYARALATIVARSSGGAGGIVAVGVEVGRTADFALQGWNDPANGGPGAPVTLVTGGAISTVDFAQYRVLYVPSDGESIHGGISDADLGRLAARRADIATFIAQGGGVFALTEGKANPTVAFAWLPISLVARSEEHRKVAPLGDLSSPFPGVTATAENLSHSSHAHYHNVWTGPAGFGGLNVLVVETESGASKPVILSSLEFENCTNGVDDDGDGLLDGADPNCHVCGDGRVDPGEQCDDRNQVAGDGCAPDCTREICGNARLDPGEACDDGNATSGDGCDANCTPTRCGNGILTAGEQCDDGNATSGDGCDANCTPTACGNGIVTAGEECDDGNLVDGDCCSVACRSAVDGIPCGGGGDVCTGTRVCQAGTCAPPTPGLEASCLGTNLIAFVTNFDDGTLSIIPTPTNAVATTIQVGRGAWGAALDPRGRELYVTNREDGTVTVVDAVARVASGTIAVGRLPLGVLFDPAGTRAYVANFDDRSVSVIDTASRAVVATIPVGRGPAGLLFDPDGIHLYVSNFAAETVSVIDTLTNKVVATVQTGRSPLEMAVDGPRGRVYVANFRSASVSVIGTFSKTVLRTIRVGRKPFGVALDASRARAYVTNAADDTVSAIATDANAVVGTIPVGNGPLGIGVDPLRGRAYVANGTDGSVSVIDISAGAVSATLPVGRLPIAFGPFIGAIANACPLRALVCDDGNPSTVDACVAPGTCRHTSRAGLEAVAAALDALVAALGSASPDVLGDARRAQALRDAVDRARAGVAAAAAATDERVRRRSLRGVKGELRQVTRILEKGLRNGSIAADVGLRLLDLGRGARTLVRKQP